ncbi:hypothetical protein LDL08_35560 [Nonomuraea glycinis]|uniref:Uncharacterized protein n=1 Tax=Nonomuraea glycinis TaxID=2047744 RepID=A0A918ADX5_9ACTN|nr:hypothetical protein [Nonomuraea glycinis]MCA2181493.1 hypothetical protein [Nonomuraea glycinis]GGP14593.1 hypothetical protein GCM10012278_71020 [Nonomuraea glycinis]
MRRNVAIRIVEVGHSDTDETSVLHVPDLDLVVRPRISTLQRISHTPIVPS